MIIEQDFGMVWDEGKSRDFGLFWAFSTKTHQWRNFVFSLSQHDDAIFSKRLSISDQVLCSFWLIVWVHYFCPFPSRTSFPLHQSHSYLFFSYTLTPWTLSRLWLATRSSLCWKNLHYSIFVFFVLSSSHPSRTRPLGSQYCFHPTLSLLYNYVHPP